MNNTYLGALQNLNVTIKLNYTPTSKASKAIWAELIPFLNKQKLGKSKPEELKHFLDDSEQYITLNFNGLSFLDFKANLLKSQYSVIHDLTGLMKEDWTKDTIFQFVAFNSVHTAHYNEINNFLSELRTKTPKHIKVLGSKPRELDIDKLVFSINELLLNELTNQLEKYHSIINSLFSMLGTKLEQAKIHRNKQIKLLEWTENIYSHRYDESVYIFFEKLGANNRFIKIENSKTQLGQLIAAFDKKTNEFSPIMWEGSTAELHVLVDILVDGGVLKSNQRWKAAANMFIQSNGKRFTSIKLGTTGESHQTDQKAVQFLRHIAQPLVKLAKKGPKES